MATIKSLYSGVSMGQMGAVSRGRTPYISGGFVADYMSQYAPNILALRRQMENQKRQQELMEQQAKREREAQRNQMIMQGVGVGARIATYEPVYERFTKPMLSKTRDIFMGKSTLPVTPTSPTPSAVPSAMPSYPYRSGVSMPTGGQAVPQPTQPVQPAQGFTRTAARYGGLGLSAFSAGQFAGEMGRTREEDIALGALGGIGTTALFATGPVGWGTYAVMAGIGAFSSRNKGLVEGTKSFFKHLKRIF